MLGSELCRSLPGLYDFTGCDSVSAFQEKGKVTALELSKQKNSFQTLEFFLLHTSFITTQLDSSNGRKKVLETNFAGTKKGLSNKRCHSSLVLFNGGAMYISLRPLFRSLPQTESGKKGTNQRWKRLLKEGAEKSRYGKGICEAVDLILTNITIHIEPWLPCGGLYPVYSLDFRRSLEYTLHREFGEECGIFARTAPGNRTQLFPGQIGI